MLLHRCREFFFRAIILLILLGEAYWRIIFDR